MKFKEFLNESDNKTEFNKLLRKLISIEKKSVKTNNTLLNFGNDWEDLNNEIIKNYSENWEEYTDKIGFSSDYNFGDILA